MVDWRHAAAERTTEGEVLNVPDRLVRMTLLLGQPQRDYVIQREGNTSVRADRRSFWAKSSGSRMADVDQGSFVRVRTARVLALLEGPRLTEQEMRSGFAVEVMERAGPNPPSTETAMPPSASPRAGRRSSATATAQPSTPPSAPRTPSARTERPSSRPRR